jgi:hypothetical protein
MQSSGFHVLARHARASKGRMIQFARVIFSHPQAHARIHLIKKNMRLFMKYAKHAMPL